jgi:hypothetical protein
VTRGAPGRAAHGTFQHARYDSLHGVHHGEPRREPRHEPHREPHGARHGVLHGARRMRRREPRVRHNAPTRAGGGTNRVAVRVAVASRCERHSPQEVMRSVARAPDDGGEHTGDGGTTRANTCDEPRDDAATTALTRLLRADPRPWRRSGCSRGVPGA